MKCDIIFSRWFVVVFVDVVNFILYVCSCCAPVVAVMKEVQLWKGSVGDDGRSLT